MFEGGDENATALGGNGMGGEGSSGPQMTYNGMSPEGPSIQGGVYSAGGGDPAEAAAMQAERGADIDTQNANQNIAMSVSGGIGRSAGLFSAIEGLVGPRQKRLRKSQRVFSRAQAKAGIDNARRALDQYKQDSAIEEQRLNQSYSGRGIGQSSIQQEGMQYFHDTEARKMAALEQNINLAQLGQRLNQSQISASYANTWTSFGNSVAALF